MHIVTRYVCTVACIFCAKCHISFTVNNLHFFEMNPRNVYSKRNMIFEFSVLQNKCFLNIAIDISKFSMHTGLLEGILPQNKISQSLSTVNKQQTRHEKKGGNEVD